MANIDIDLNLYIKDIHATFESNPTERREFIRSDEVAEYVQEVTYEIADEANALGAQHLDDILIEGYTNYKHEYDAQRKYVINYYDQLERYNTLRAAAEARVEKNKRLRDYGTRLAAEYYKKARQAQDERTKSHLMSMHKIYADLRDKYSKLGQPYKGIRSPGRMKSSMSNLVKQGFMSKADYIADSGLLYTPHLEPSPTIYHGALRVGHIWANVYGTRVHNKFRTLYEAIAIVEGRNSST